LNLVILRVIVQARYDLQLSLSNSRSVFRWEKKEHALARLEYCFKPMVGDWVLNPADEFFQSPVSIPNSSQPVTSSCMLLLPMKSSERPSAVRFMAKSFSSLT